MIKSSCVALLLFCALTGVGRAAEFNIATLTCVKYQNEVVGAQAGGGGPDPINTVMWLFGAISAVHPDTKNPMDLNSVDCASFENRHLDMAKTDAESADTIMMWLFGFAAAKSSSHMFDPAGLKAFGAALLADCRANPNRSLYDELSAVKLPKPQRPS
jgi:hypothetical protein